MLEACHNYLVAMIYTSMTEAYIPDSFNVLSMTLKHKLTNHAEQSCCIQIRI
jgi:hypothetical protein